MKVNLSTEKMLKIVYVLSWILFIGLCIEAGGFITNLVLVFFNPSIVSHLWQQIDLSNLFEFSQGYFVLLTSIMSIVAIMKALLFYLIVKILHDKKLNVTKPFSREFGSFIFNVSYLTFGIGLFSFVLSKYAGWLLLQDVKMPDAHSLRIEGADVWIFMALTLKVIAQIFKRGIEMQEENELTI